MPNTPPFIGTGWGFPPQFHKASRSVHMVQGEQDIQESLSILLTTTITERLLQPTYGCDLKIHVFDPLDTGLKAYIQDLIETAILYHEPRIRLDSITLEDVPADGMLIITLDYRIRQTNSRSNFVFPFYKSEGAIPSQ